jgi:hypothetical protein
MESIKKNAIVIYYPFLDGTSTSLIDSFYNLKNYVNNIYCYILFDSSKNMVKQNIEYIKTLNHSVPIKLLNPIYVDIHSLNEFIKHNKFNNLIMSFGVFRFIDSIPFQYEKLILLDAGRIIYDFYNQNSKFINYVKGLPNTIMLGNKMNQAFFDWENYFIYYHKFSKERFNHLKKLHVIEGSVSSCKRTKNGNMLLNNMMLNELHYNRWRSVTDDNSVFSENIGKMIFEFSALGKKVYYSPLNKTHDDGLTEYLRLFNIDDSFEQQINITEQQLFDKLGFHKNDLLLSALKKGN